jgi:hypothetical protein
MYQRVDPRAAIGSPRSAERVWTGAIARAESSGAVMLAARRGLRVQALPALRRCSARPVRYYRGRRGRRRSPASRTLKRAREASRLVVKDDAVGGDGTRPPETSKLRSRPCSAEFVCNPRSGPEGGLPARGRRGRPRRPARSRWGKLTCAQSVQRTRPIVNVPFVFVGPRVRRAPWSKADDLAVRPRSPAGSPADSAPFPPGCPRIRRSRARLRCNAPFEPRTCPGCRSWSERGRGSWTR